MDDETNRAINVLKWLHIKQTPETIEATIEGMHYYSQPLQNKENNIFQQIDNNLQFFDISYVENPPDPKCIIKKDLDKCDNGGIVDSIEKKD
jgi:hypothetical protein